MTAGGLKREESEWPGVSWPFFGAMVGRWARAGTGFARDALHATITVCVTPRTSWAEDVNAEVCGCGALFLYVRLMRRRY